MNELKTFREEARKRNLCAKYSRAWDKCVSKKQLIDLALDSNGIPYICESTSQGWGLAPRLIADKFKTFINGRYESKHEGYTSSLYVEHMLTMPLVVSTTNVVLINCVGTVEVPQNVVCNVFVVGGDLTVTGTGRCYLHRYGECNFRFGQDLILFKN